MPATLFGYRATLTLDLDGEPLDVSDCIGIGDAGNAGGIYIDARKLLSAIEVEREVRRRLSTDVPASPET